MFILHMYCGNKLNSHPSGSSFHPTSSICVYDREVATVLIHIDKLLQSRLPFLTGTGPTYEKQYLKHPV